MTTQEEIETELNRYIAAGNRKPDNLYIGVEQHADIQREAARYGIIADPNVVSARLRFCGMKVYKVDARCFVGFGPETPSPCG